MLIAVIRLEWIKLICVVLSVQPQRASHFPVLCPDIHVLFVRIKQSVSSPSERGTLNGVSSISVSPGVMYETGAVGSQCMVNEIKELSPDGHAVTSDIAVVSTDCTNVLAIVPLQRI